MKLDTGNLRPATGVMSGHHLEIVPQSRHHWIVRYEGDVTPLSEHETQTEARAEARNCAQRFGEPEIHVHELDGGCHAEQIDAELGERAPGARSAQRNGYRERGWDTGVGEIELAIPKLRSGSYFPSAVHETGRREVIGLDVGEAETEAFWREF